ncbi:cryptochrome/photolyase family protein [Natronospira sp.]|uniref:cryptochrome/photolyase family protein n=1 Tax=Natronospira sp. TaxID=2024970 RepID=UPI0038732FDD
MVRLVLILGDQLSERMAALKAADQRHDVVVMAEVDSETGYVAHHPKKIAFTLTAMRKFASHLEQQGWTVAYTRLDDPDNTGSIPDELGRRAREFETRQVLATEPGEWRLLQALEASPLDLKLLEDDRFLCSRQAFADWARGRKTLRMEHFYRTMRRHTGLLMEGNKPVGAKWNFDHDNRKAASEDLFRRQPPAPGSDNTLDAVLALVEERFADNFGTLRPFNFHTDRKGALKVLDHFIRHALPDFGRYQDAMLTGEPYLYHSVLSPYLNAGLLDPLEVCQAAEAAYHQGQAPINSVEGFIRQIIGWREFVRGIYFLEGPDYSKRNALKHDKDLPPMYWGAKTHMHCMAEAIGQTESLAYAHHIQRLMITGNFALLAGIDPAQVQEWYLAVYADAYEWVEAPNTAGMSQFADGGLFASKPYVSSGAYINRMSNYCQSCPYQVTHKTGDKACPFNVIYWHFLNRHRKRFEANPRMATMYRNWDKMDAEKRKTIIEEASGFLDRLHQGETV